MGEYAVGSILERYCSKVSVRYRIGVSPIGLFTITPASRSSEIPSGYPAQHNLGGAENKFNSVAGLRISGLGLFSPANLITYLFLFDGFNSGKLAVNVRTRSKHSRPQEIALPCGNTTSGNG
jgi:hypothetical protein